MANSGISRKLKGNRLFSTRNPRRNRKTLIELALLGLPTALPALKGPDFASDFRM
jgi:hypothetical protein